MHTAAGSSIATGTFTLPVTRDTTYARTFLAGHILVNMTSIPHNFSLVYTFA
jgi:hypothetical protein